MLEEIKNIKSKKSDLRKFGTTIGIILMVISGLLHWEGKESYQILLTMGVVLCGLGVVMPVLLKPIYWIWMIFATILGWFMTRVILSLLYYGTMTPISLVSRLFGKQFLELKWNKKDSTYWNYQSKKIFEKEKYEKQF